MNPSSGRAVSAGGKRRKILAAGMMPPPLGGQALMFETAVKSLSKSCDVHVLDLQAQRNIGAAGSLSSGKILRLGQILGAAVGEIARERRFDTLYYCPSGPSTIGLLKDIALLGLLRPFCRRTVFHFHGTGGIAALLQMNKFVVSLAKKSVWKPDVALRCAPVSPDDAALCEARETIIVPNGIPDPLHDFGSGYQWSPPDRPVLTFIGAMTEEKGIFDLVEVARLLRDRGLDFVVNLVGEGTEEEIGKFDALVERYGLSEQVRRLGVLRGKEKFAALAGSSLFVFPTFFRAETQPLVVIEAFAIGLPAVAYRWRGLDTIIDDGLNGYLVEARNAEDFADAVEKALTATDLGAFSKQARSKFEGNFTLAAFEKRIGEILAT